MTLLQNPYTSMLLTPTSAHVYGREKHIINILAAVSAPRPNSLALYGIRTIGKTTLLKYLKDKEGALRQYNQHVGMPYNRKTGGHLIFVYVNCRRFDEDSNLFFIMWEHLRDELTSDELQSEDLIADVNMPLPVNGEDKRSVMVRLLTRLLRKLEDYSIRVVFLLDDFDVPLRITDAIDDVDDGLLRVLSDDTALVIVSEEPITDIRPDIDSESSPLLGILHPTVVGLLSTTDAKKLITEPLRNSAIAFNEEEQQFLIDVAGRQPFLLSVACELYFDLMSGQSVKGTLDGKEARQKFESRFVSRLLGLPQVEGVLNRVWSRLTEDEQVALYEISNQGTVLEPGGDRRSVNDRLANKSLVFEEFFGGPYHLFSRLFSTFVQEKRRVQADVQLVEEHISRVSESLSPIDRALYEYLYKHADQVCTFEELLDAVWGDSDSKSKRALEAAVHRLRGKGEDIKNIRGKGYKFTSTDVVNKKV